MDQPKIDCSKIPAIEMRLFSRTFIEAIKRSTKDPEFMAEFEEYMRRKKENECT